MKANNITYNYFEYRSLNNTFNIKRYSSVDLETINNYLNTIDSSWFEYLKIETDQPMESALYSYYHSEDYYDLILLINYRNLIDGIPFSNDKILNDINNDLEEYNIKLFNQGITFNTFTIEPETCIKSRTDNADELQKNRRLGPYQRLKLILGYKYNKLNNYHLFLKVPKHKYIHKIINGIRDIITTEQEVLELQDLNYNS